MNLRSSLSTSRRSAGCSSVTWGSRRAGGRTYIFVIVTVVKNMLSVSLQGHMGRVEPGVPLGGPGAVEASAALAGTGGRGGPGGPPVQQSSQLVLGSNNRRQSIYQEVLAGSVQKMPRVLLERQQEGRLQYQKLTS